VIRGEVRYRKIAAVGVGGMVLIGFVGCWVRKIYEGKLRMKVRSDSAREWVKCNLPV
jgi:hypothetical protein